MGAESRPCVACGHPTRSTVLDYDGPGTGEFPMCRDTEACAARSGWRPCDGSRQHGQRITAESGVCAWCGQYVALDRFGVLFDHERPAIVGGP